MFRFVPPRTLHASWGISLIARRVVAKGCLEARYSEYMSKSLTFLNLIWSRSPILHFDHLVTKWFLARKASITRPQSPQSPQSIPILQQDVRVASRSQPWRCATFRRQTPTLSTVRTWDPAGNWRFLNVGDPQNRGFPYEIDLNWYILDDLGVP